MVLFSRSFIRKRMISLATTASVAATSFALAEDPAKTDHVRRATPIQGPGRPWAECRYPDSRLPTPGPASRTSLQG